MNRGPRTGKRRWQVFWPFVALCLLSSIRWLLEGALPNLASSGFTEAVGCSMAAGLFFLGFVVRRADNGKTMKGSRPRYFLAGNGWVAALILTAPALLGVLSDRNINANNATLALSLTPVVVAVATAAFGNAESADLTGRLWPGLAGLAGLLLLIPQPDFSSVRFTVALAGVPLFMGVAAAMAGRREEGESGSERGSVEVRDGIALVLASAVFLSLSLAGHTHTVGAFSLGAAAYDGLLAILTLLALRRLGPVRWSAQFLVVPLFTLLEGVVVLKPFLDLRSWVGLGLMAAGSLYLLL